MSDFVKRYKKEAMDKLDSYLQGNVNRAYELGEVLGDVAAGGAALSSAAAETLLPDSETSLIPAGRIAQGVKRIMPPQVKELLRKSMRDKGYDMKKTEDALVDLEQGDKWKAVLEKRAAPAVKETAESLAKPVQFQKLVDQSKEVVGTVKGPYKPDAAQSAAAAAGGQRAKQLQESGSVRANHVPGKDRKKLEEDELEKRLEEL
jgi:hypothetical protein